MRRRPNTTPGTPIREVEIIRTDTAVWLECALHPDLVIPARLLGGTFDRKTGRWWFDPRDEGRVRMLVRRVFGTDGDDDPERVTVHVYVHANEGTWKEGRIDRLFIGGRQVARVYGRDAGPVIGACVVVVAGAFYSAGSKRNPGLCARIGTEILIRQLPRSAAERVVREHLAQVIVE